MSHPLKFAGLLVSASLLPFVIPAAAIAHEAPVQADTVDTSVPTQLPRTAVPHHYAISIVPYAKALSFGATAKIDLEIVKPTDRLVLNAADLDIASATLRGPDGMSHSAQVALDEDEQTASFDFGEQLPNGGPRQDRSGTVCARLGERYPTLI